MRSKSMVLVTFSLFREVVGVGVVVPPLPRVCAWACPNAFPISLPMSPRPSVFTAVVVVKITPAIITIKPKPTIRPPVIALAWQGLSNVALPIPKTIPPSPMIVLEELH